MIEKRADVARLLTTEDANVAVDEVGEAEAHLSMNVLRRDVSSGEHLGSLIQRRDALMVQVALDDSVELTVQSLSPVSLLSKGVGAKSQRHSCERVSFGRWRMERGDDGDDGCLSHSRRRRGCRP